MLPRLTTPPPPGPEPNPYEMESNMAAIALGQKPEPAIRLDAMIHLHGKLAKLIKQLDAEIKELKHGKT